jgi:hypothetical protein
METSSASAALKTTTRSSIPTGNAAAPPTDRR